MFIQYLAGSYSPTSSSSILLNGHDTIIHFFYFLFNYLESSLGYLDSLTGLKCYHKSNSVAIIHCNQCHLKQNNKKLTIWSYMMISINFHFIIWMSLSTGFEILWFIFINHPSLFYFINHKKGRSFGERDR